MCIISGDSDAHCATYTGGPSQAPPGGSDRHQKPSDSLSSWGSSWRSNYQTSQKQTGCR